MKAMQKLNTFKLVEGQFTPSDSINILFALFNSKINFHQLESFKIQERNSNNKNFLQHENRIVELKEAYLLMKAMIKEASDDNMDLQIHGNIKIKAIKRDSK